MCVWGKLFQNGFPVKCGPAKQTNITIMPGIHSQDLEIDVEDLNYYRQSRSARKLMWFIRIHEKQTELRVI